MDRLTFSDTPAYDLLSVLAGALRGQAPPSDVDWAGLVTLAQAHGTGPLLLRAAQRGAVTGLPAGQLALLQAERAEVAVQQMLAVSMQRRMSQVFEDAGVPCIWLKGVVLAHTVYAEPALRPMVDVDVLVPYAQRERALAAAEAAGFGTASTQLFDGRDGLKHHYFLRSDAYHPLSLELHYRLLGPLDRLLTVEDQKWFWAQTDEAAGADGAAFITLRPEAHLLYLCAHALLQHGEAELRMIQLVDVDRILAASPAFDWELLVDAAVRLRWTRAVERTLALAQAALRTPVPETALAQLEALRPPNERAERIARRQRSQSKTETVLDDLRAMSWPSRLRAAGRILAPPPRYMRWRYGLASNRGLPAAYARRVGRVTADAWRSLRRRRTV